ncbi:uncharacterized protein LOC130744553 [Lotus japonicus]|uniref:uncharacterized protein LOC130744553 n=1 Tax=Lotus japonicus TaxID=34305 RepID=UPI0025830A83|nr:uncharacterized protein LOC130744553 [Lotus japonicus]
MVIILLLCLCFTLQNFEVDGHIPNLSQNGYLDSEFEERLKIINKPPIKSIHTVFGHIVDCIDINKQLAFDNPLLKNHKIQLKPSFKETTTELKVNESIFPTLGNDLCPEGTIPVRRATKEDLIREKLFSNNIGTLTLVNPGTHFAGVRLNLRPKVYIGINGTISVYTPTVEEGQMSSAYIWASNGTDPNYENNIQAGWQVYPTLSGDVKAHFYTSWSNGHQKTGCTNLLCAGFVQTSQRIYLGTPFSSTSTYGGPTSQMTVSLTQEEITTNWWLRAENTYIGYFPKELFSGYLYYADQAGWTGKTIRGNLPSPPMGSGHLPDGNYRHSAYIARMAYRDRQRQDAVPLTGELVLDADSPQCYNVTWDKYVDDNLQHTIEFGGPGGLDCEP